MTESSLEKDLAELGLAPGASFAAVKAAFRQAAFKFHPDRGGDPVWFVRAYDAYRRLCEHFESEEERPSTRAGVRSEAAAQSVDELSQRLSEFDAAFASIRKDLVEAESKWVEQIRKEAVAAVNRASSCGEVDAVLRRAISLVSQRLAEHATKALDDSLGRVADDFNSWMLSWLTPYYEQVRAQQSLRWYRSATAGYMAVFGGVAALMYPVGGGAWAFLRLGCGALGGYFLARPAHSVLVNLRYRAEIQRPTLGAP